MSIESKKIYTSFHDLKIQVESWKSLGKKIVFTNGCFDLIHIGHIQYLKEAKSKGDILVVGINSTKSVSKLKGLNRPINDEKTRCGVMAAFYFTDAVIVFNEDTPYDLIKEIKPDVLVKGGDWSIDQIVGSDLVLQNGGSVLSLSFMDGYSTTNIENKIIEAYKSSLKI
jgi:D-glycero-beta-D-manno-heptose 1-phosphate adenylyltransferase